MSLTGLTWTGRVTFRSSGPRRPYGNWWATLRPGRSSEELSGRFHATVAAALAEAVRRVYRETGIMTVVLSGGCFQNQILTRALKRALARMGLNVYTQSLVPANDGGLSLGQAVSAGMRYKK